MSIEALSRGQIRIRIDKPTPPRVIIPALQIVQPRFRVVNVSAVAQGVLCAEGARQRACGGQRIAPCVVGVGHDARAAGADETGHIALCVLDVEVLRAVAVHGQRAGRVVGKVQLIAAPRQLHQLVAQIMVIVRRAVDSLRDALAVGIVAVGDGAHRRTETSGRIGVLCLAPDVAAVIVGIRPRLPRRLIILAHITRDSHAGIISFLIPCGPIMVMLLETG